MRACIAEEVLRAYLTGDYYYRKGNTLKIDMTGLITSQNTPMGYIVSEETPDGVYRDFLILSLQNYKSQKNWKTQKKQLAEAANKFGLMVIFVPFVDMFANCENNWKEYAKTNSFGALYDLLFNNLIATAKHSQDDIKTACAAFINDEFNEYDTIYSYNQFINDEFVHAEEVICQFCKCKQYEVESFLMLLEPCVDCLKHMIAIGGRLIQYAQFHKGKWTTPEFIEYTNDIFNKTILSNRGRPICFAKINNKKVDGFYKPKEAK